MPSYVVRDQCGISENIVRSSGFKGLLKNVYRSHNYYDVCDYKFYIHHKVAQSFRWLVLWPDSCTSNTPTHTHMQKNRMAKLISALAIHVSVVLPARSHKVDY